jgi:hypothetical protein
LFIFWSAIIIAAGLSTILSFQINDHGVSYVFQIILFFISSTGVLIEIFKWPLGKRKIDNSKGFARFIFGDVEDSFGEHHLFLRESVLSAKKGRGYLVVWIYFLFFLLFLGLSLFWFFSN